jgi:hypothetical protein
VFRFSESGDFLIEHHKQKISALPTFIVGCSSSPLVAAPAATFATPSKTPLMALSLWLLSRHLSAVVVVPIFEVFMLSFVVLIAITVTLHS